jgi:hypothetical protein
MDGKVNAASLQYSNAAQHISSPFRLRTSITPVVGIEQPNSLASGICVLCLVDYRLCGCHEGPPSSHWLSVSCSTCVPS